MANLDFDVAIVGAGVSGIDMAYHIQHSTKLSYQIFDTRDEIGGTWSINNFAGIRSDIDMFSYQFPFRPWTGKEAVAEGWQIKQYLKDVAHEFDIDKQMNFGHKVKFASWSSKEKCWTLQITVRGEKEKTVKTRFLCNSGGYYDYNEAYFPKLTGHDAFEGQTIHPQFWPKDFSYKDKKVVIIGSGATTSSMFPAMVDQVGSGSVTILQRSPSYYLTISRVRPVINFFRRWFPKTMCRLLRIYSGSFDFIRFIVFRAFPNLARRYLQNHVRRQLPPGVPVDPHFTPRYVPWHQRLCFVPDGDFFKALAPGKGGHIVTGVIDTVVKDGIQLTDGTKLDCDIIVQATGLNLAVASAFDVEVDGRIVRSGDTWWYRAHMLSGIPNYIYTIGSFFQGWTLAADIVSRSFVKLATHMERKGYRSATPTLPANIKQYTAEWVSSGYYKRGAWTIPKQSTSRTWRARTEWFDEWLDLRFGSVSKDMVFAK